MFRVLLAMAVLALPAAAAHGDAPRIEADRVVEPGASVAFLREIHYHRVLGSVRADEPVVLDIQDTTVAGPGQHLRVDHLIACCKEATWTEHALTVRNDGQAPATVRIDLRLLHDDFAVVADDAEPGARWQTFLIVSLIAAVPAWMARRRVEGPAAPRWRDVSIRLQAGVWSVAAALSLAGMLAYRVGPLRGHLAASGWFAVPTRAVSSHTLLAVALMAVWTAAAVFWARAHRTGGALRTGYALAAGPLVVGALFALEYRAAAAAMALVPAVLLALAARPWSK